MVGADMEREKTVRLLREYATKIGETDAAEGDSTTVLKELRKCRFVCTPKDFQGMTRLQLNVTDDLKEVMTKVRAALVHFHAEPRWDQPPPLALERALQQSLD